MVDATAQETETTPRKGRSLLFGSIAAIVTGVSGFAASFFDMIPLGSVASVDHTVDVAPVSAAEFVPIEALTISLGTNSTARHLRFAAQIDVRPGYGEEIRNLMPRILDVLNGYLRAVDPALLEDTSSLSRLKAQMLRRIQIVTGEGRVRDLLITEFVLH